MNISGYFHFLHAQNVAWILKCRNIAEKTSDQLTLILKNNPEFPNDSLSSRAEFIRHFHLAHKISINEPALENGPDIDSIEIPQHSREIQSILKEWISPKINNCVFTDLKQIVELKKTWSNKRVITTNGCFDILHPGHLATLSFAASKGDFLIVLINSDQSVKRFKGDQRPIHTQDFRAALLTQLDAVDAVIIFQEDTPLDLLKIIQPAGHVKGGSFIPERVKKEQDLLDQWGGVFYPFPMHGSFSTTRILEQFDTPPFPI